MSYVINKFNGQAITTIEDGTVDQTLDIKLIGKNYAGYGEIQNENFLHMLENFASATPPAKAIDGQLWFDTTTKKIKFMAGPGATPGSKLWKTTGGVEYSASEPLDATAGDLWLDTSVNQLKVRVEGSEWLSVGPQSAGAGTTQLVSRQVKASDDTLKSIIAATINNVVVYVTSKDEFSLKLGDTANEGLLGFGFSVIKKGITLAYANPTTGITPLNEEIYWGTAAAAKGLVDSEGNFVPSSSFVQSGSSVFTAIVRFADVGYTVGDSNDLAVFIESGVEPVIQNATGPKIIFRVQDGAVTQNVMTINANRLEPGANNVYSLGTTTNKWSNVHATTFTGTATQADTLKVGAEYRQASTSATADTIVCRDSAGNITSTLFNGTATSARYADLAEKYITDQPYRPGTVVTVGGDAEVRACMMADRAIGVVSTNPAYMMNSDQEGGTYIALKGRVPCFVSGPVKKGDRLIAGDNGVAIAAVPPNYNYYNTFGIALEDSDVESIKTIEVLVL